MTSSSSIGPDQARALVLVLASALVLACSAPSEQGEPTDHNGAGEMGNRPGSGLASGGMLAAGAGGIVAVAGGGAAGGGSGGNAGSSGGAGLGGAAAGGIHAGGVGGGGAPSSGGGGAASSAACSMIAADYDSELEQQLACRPNAGSQCVNRAASAPGCECRVFIEPTDPFAIEHLSNVANGWFDADCSMPSCPAQCSTAAAGTCQADPESPLGGRCITP